MTAQVVRLDAQELRREVQAFCDEIESMERLQADHALLVDVLSAAVGAIVVTDDQARVVLCGGDLLSDAEWAPDRVRGRCLWEVLPEGREGAIGRAFAQVMETGERVDEIATDHGDLWSVEGVALKRGHHRRVHAFVVRARPLGLGLGQVARR